MLQRGCAPACLVPDHARSFPDNSIPAEEDEGGAQGSAGHRHHHGLARAHLHPREQDEEPRSVLPHSLHGWVGLVAVALVVLQATTGFVKVRGLSLFFCLPLVSSSNSMCYVCSQFNRLVMFSKKSYRWHNRGFFLFLFVLLYNLPL